MAVGATFANHRGVVPMLWVFSGLACIELVSVHFLLVHVWPRAAWPISLLTALSVLWLIGWIRSWARLPHELGDGALRLHCGSLRSVVIPLAQIALVRGLKQGDLAKNGLCNLVPIAHPNRLIELIAPLAGRKAAWRVAIRLDDPMAFDAALRDAGVAVAD